MNIPQGEQYFVRCVSFVISTILMCVLLMAGVCLFLLYDYVVPAPSEDPTTAFASAAPLHHAVDVWQPPDSTLIPETAEGDMIRYGKELISHTSKYLGPRGTVRRISNGMNCQNCHLRSGAKPYGNNYAAVVSTYPKFRSRSGSIETIEKRINDCIERSLNGVPLAADSREMRAIIAWFAWLGKDVEKGVTPKGSGIMALPFLSRAADPTKGKLVYDRHCRLCHGAEGQGFRHPDSVEWKYPPLAGNHSYNTGAGLFRISRFAGYVKSNMPHGTTWQPCALSRASANR